MKRLRQTQAKGFSLVELLLTLVLILCLAAASVFCYTAIHRQANLDEGVDRLHSIIRFARAEAATTGRKIRIQFVEAQEAPEAPGLKKIRVEWEPDFLTAPGVFQVYTNKTWSEELVNELLAVKEVKPLLPKAPAAPNSRSQAQSRQAPATSDDSDSTEPSFLDELASITFYPDGSSDSAQIIVASRNDEDPRRVALTVSGMLGSVSTRLLLEEDAAEEWADDEWFDENGQARAESTSTDYSSSTDFPSRSPGSGFTGR